MSITVEKNSRYGNARDNIIIISNPKTAIGHCLIKLGDKLAIAHPRTTKIINAFKAGPDLRQSVARMK